MSKKDESTWSISAATLRHDMHILSSSYQPLITITDDGRVAIADHLTVDEAAREFWNAVLRLNPLPPRIAAPADEQLRAEIQLLEQIAACGDTSDKMALYDKLAALRAAFANKSL